jgi:hypothetical protein
LGAKQIPIILLIPFLSRPNIHNLNNNLIEKYKRKKATANIPQTLRSQKIAKVFYRGDRMDRIILLKPKGRPNPGMRWADEMPHGYILINEDTHCWYGKPVEDPVAKILTLPKFAWEVAE